MTDAPPAYNQLTPDQKRQNLAAMMDRLNAAAQVNSIIKTGQPSAVGQQAVPRPPQPPPPAPAPVKNLDQLTRTERWVMNALPAFSRGPLGKTLEAVNNSWLGKGLQFVDVLAETSERAAGLVAQEINSWKDPAERQDFYSNLKEAWYAGSLTADYSWFNIAIPIPGTDVKRFSVDMGPGVAGVVAARKRIHQLVSEGQPIGNALQQVKQEAFTDAGALALRMQTMDAAYHIFGDPANVVLPYLKPVERTQALAKFVSGAKSTPEILEATTKAADVAEETLRIAQKAAAEAQVGGDAAKIAAATEAVTQAAEVAQSARGVATLSAAKQMGPWEYRIYRALGGNVTGTVEKVQDLSKLQQMARRLNPFALTPESRVQELWVSAVDNLASRVIPDATPEEIMRVVQRAAGGVYDPRIAHMIITPEGRQTMALLQLISTKVTDAGTAWKMVEGDRRLLNTLATILGDTPDGVLARLDDGEHAAIMAEAAQAASQMPDGERVVAALSQMTPDVLEALPSKLRVVADGTEWLLHSDEAFKAGLIGAVADQAARVGVAAFGVKSRGFIQSLASATKAAESLAFLRLNPGYPIRNFLNNTFTMIARGGMGLTSVDDMVKFWDKMGFQPPRLAAGFGIAGESVGVKAEAAAETAARVVLGEATRPTGQFSKTLEGIEHFIKGAPVPSPVDMGRYAVEAEKSASLRAMTTFFQRGYKQFASVGNSLPEVAAFDRGLAATLGDELVGRIEKAVSGHYTEADLESAVFKDNLNLNMDSVLDRASRNMGIDIRSQLPEEFLAQNADNIIAAAKRGPAYVDRALNEIRTSLQTHLDDIAEKEFANLADEMASRVQAEGPNAFLKTWTDQVDEWYGVQSKQAMDVSQLADVATAAKPELAGKIWDHIQEMETKFYGRAWKRFEGRMTAMADAAKASKLPGADEVLRNFKSWRGGWEEFFATRNEAYKAFFAGENKGPEAWAALRQELDGAYEAMVGKESEHMSAIDTLVGGMVPDDRRPLFMAVRNAVNELRQSDRELVIEFRKGLPDIPREARNAAYAEHWAQRRQNWLTQWQAERAGIAAQMGNQEATAVFAGMEPVPESILTTAGGPVPERLVTAGKLTPGMLQKLPRSQLPQQISDNIKYIAQAMADELSGAEPGQRLSFKTVEGGAEVKRWTGVASTYPDWYGEFLREYHTNRQAVLTGLDKIIRDRGADTGKMVERLKELGLDRLLEGDFGLYRAPPDPLLLRIFGKPEADVQAAAREWMRQGFPNPLEMPPPEVAAATRVHPTLPPGVFDEIVPPEPPIGVGQDQYWYTIGDTALQSLGDAAKEIRKEPAFRFADIPEELQGKVRAYVEDVKVGMADARYSATRFAEYGRDSALLNYNRRYNYNAWLGTVMPYEFWMTQSLYKWALHSIDRPAMLSTYLRMKYFLDTAFRPENGGPSRLEGKIRIPLPFLPDWMGKGVFVDPFRTLLPFDSFMQPINELERQRTLDQGNTERVLNELLTDGKINPEEFQNALTTHAGPVWERAYSLMRQDNAEERANAFDIAALVSSPHAPLMWGYNILNGHPENIGPFMPLTRGIKGLTALLGIGPAGGWSPEGSIRKAMGLPEFDKWDDYRIDRQLSDMASDPSLKVNGEPVTVEQIQRAMIDRTGPIFEEAKRRAGQEFGVGAMGSMTGVPLMAYPEGEAAQRSLSGEYQAAWKAYEAGDTEAVQRFNDAHPGYETRLALYKTPEERLQSFLIDQLWNKYNSVPDLTRHQYYDQLGPLFQRSFVNKDTRSYANISPRQMAVWLKLMGGDPPGSLDTRDSVPLDLAPPDVAAEAQGFYDGRDMNFPNWHADQDAYMKLKTAQEKTDFLRLHSDYAGYLNFRDSWLAQHTDVLPYISDTPKKPSDTFNLTAYIDQQGDLIWPGVSEANKQYEEALARNPTYAATILQSRPDVLDFRKWEASFRSNYNRMAKYGPQANRMGQAANEIAPPDSALGRLIQDAYDGEPLPANVAKYLQSMGVTVP